MSVYNLKNPAIKRLMKEAEELMHATDEYYAQPLENDLFEWHFSIRGPPNSDFEGGIYHGRIILPPDYPMTPPNIVLLTPNGRFETDKKICLSISGHHPESWLPSWSIRTSLLALIGFMPTHGNGALGSLDYTPAERKDLAVKSQEFKCRDCGSIKDIFLKRKSSELAIGTAASIALCNDVQKEISKATFVSPEGTSNESTSENHDPQKNIQSRDDRQLPIHRHKSSASKGMPDKTSHTENISEVAQINAESEVVVFNSGYNLLHLVFIIFIVFALLLLILRRIFFM